MISVDWQTDDGRSKAIDLSERLNIPCHVNTPVKLIVGHEGLFLTMSGTKPLQVNFSYEWWKKKLNQNHGLIQACKIKAGSKVLDLTAGWGRDAALMAVFGAEVSLCERNPIMQVMLADGLKRRGEIDKKKMKLFLLDGSAQEVLEGMAEGAYPDIIYFDPMHPERKKSALVKKDLQILQQFIPPDDDAKAIINLARQCVKHRLVVKWPRKIPALMPPDFTCEGKTIRYDVYLSVIPKKPGCSEAEPGFRPFGPAPRLR